MRVSSTRLEASVGGERAAEGQGGGAGGQGGVDGSGGTQRREQDEVLSDGGSAARLSREWRVNVIGGGAGGGGHFAASSLLTYHVSARIENCGRIIWQHDLIYQF